jgi:exosortase A-associated hydrolase 2
MIRAWRAEDTSRAAVRASAVSSQESTGSAVNSIRREAFFLPMPNGQRFCIVHEPASSGRGAILFVPPFAEEMNKSRRMVALQARAFAEHGWTVLQMDLFGTGDSSGDFGDATWQDWLADVRRAIRWLQERTRSTPIVWGLRAGCLLAARAADETGSPVRLLFWQPVLSGKQHLQQFLRLKVANQLVLQPGQPRITTQQLRDQLAHGEAVEVAGYLLNPGLALPFEGAALELARGDARVVWLEVSASANASLSPASSVRVQAWQSAGCDVEAQAVTGAAFWQTQEITECDSLIGETLRAISRWQ